MTSGIYILVEHLKGTVEDITYVMLAASRELAEKTGNEVVAVLLGSDVKELAQDLAASKVLIFDHPDLSKFSPDAYLHVLTNLFMENPPRAFIAGHTSVGMDIVCGLASKLNFPIISQCQQFIFEQDEIKFISQICGGKIKAEGILPEPSVVVSFIPGSYKAEQGKSGKAPEIQVMDTPEIGDLNINLIEYIEPELGEVDISKQEVLIAVGRGLQNQNDIELTEELAVNLGGAVCTSRPIVDQGWLPSSRLVGKSGKTVAPKLYIALGISGAPEHTQSITDSDLIIAVNTDPNAPIFEIAKYGVEEDVVDFLVALKEQFG